MNTICMLVLCNFMEKPTYLDFYFDYISPYAYFAWRRISTLCDTHHVELRIHPIVFGKLLDHWGQRGPAEIPPKREWLFKYCDRYATINRFEFNPPRHHPFNPLSALRCSLKEVCGDKQRELISAIFKACWSQGKDIGHGEALAPILKETDLDSAGLMRKIAQKETKQILIQETQEAIGHGVFGVPSMIVNQQLFWGNDQMDHVALALQGKDPLNLARVTEVLSRPRGVDRKALKQ